MRRGTSNWARSTERVTDIRTEEYDSSNNKYARLCNAVTIEMRDVEQLYFWLESDV